LLDQEKAEHHKNDPQQKSFLQKMYQDEDEYDELKVLGGLDEDDAEVQ